MQPQTAKTKPGTALTYPKIVCKDGVLKLMCNLQRADFSVFQELCAQLCRSNYETVTIDFTMCTYVNSLVIGSLVDTVTQLKTDGKEVTVLVSPEVGRFLHMAHLYHLFAYEIVEPGT
jgi:anti-anti-sigma regulatory factor